jgi:hypothetical protein
MICPGCGVKMCSSSASLCRSFSLIICADWGSMWPRDDTGRVGKAAARDDCTCACCGGACDRCPCAGVGSLWICVELS